MTTGPIKSDLSMARVILAWIGREFGCTHGMGYSTYGFTHPHITAWFNQSPPILEFDLLVDHIIIKYNDLNGYKKNTEILYSDPDLYLKIAREIRIYQVDRC